MNEGSQKNGESQGSPSPKGRPNLSSVVAREVQKAEDGGRPAQRSAAPTFEVEKASGTVSEISSASAIDGPLSKIKARTSFARWPMIVGWFAMLVFTFHACTHMVAAGDTWVAMACGRHFVNHGVDTVEPFSANSHKAGPTLEEVKTWPGWAQWITDKVGLDTVKKVHPTGWVNQNWLTHVIFYKLTTMLGSEDKPYFDALVFWKFAIYILVVVCLYFTSRLLGVNPVLAVVFACAAMFIGRSFLDVRPAGFSNLMVPAFLLVLALTSYRNALYVWLIVPLIAFWSNVHGGYIYAFLMLAPFVAWHVIMSLPKRWSVAVYTIGTWAAMCLLAHQVYKIEFLAEQAIPLRRDWVLYVFLVAAAGTVALTCNRKVSARALVGFSVATSLVLFLVFLAKFFQASPRALTEYGWQLFRQDLNGAVFAYAGIFLFATILGVAVASVRDRIVQVMPPRAILHTVVAGVVAFVAMVIFNPFHLTNLTHTFVISVSSAAERWRDVHEWHRAFDWTNPVGTAIPFLIVYVLGWACLAIWAVVVIRHEQLAGDPGRKKKPPVRDARTQKDSLGAAEGEYVWPKVDLAFLVIAGMTIYMGIRSRRFIPIAAYAACPVLALIIHEAIGRLLSMIGTRRTSRIESSVLVRSVFEASIVGMAASLAIFGLFYLIFERWLFIPIPNSDRVRPNIGLTLLWTLLPVVAFVCSVVLYSILRWPGATKEDTVNRGFAVKPLVSTALILLCAYVAGVGTYVGWKFNDVYLKYWPADPKLTSVFMRLTASDAKPFCATQFIRENNLAGNMFNYWTEGGFIAWGQTPDPKTGRTPLQLFMDGRAQAAYSRTVFDEWTDIISGGPVVTQAARAGRAPRSNEYPQIAQWVSEQLRKHEVWVVLMPSNQFDIPFVMALEDSPDWRTVFTNNKQKLFVDIRTEAGRRLYDDMMAGRARYPDEFSANMARGHNLLLSDNAEQRKQGLDLVIKAFEQERSPSPVLDMLLLAARYPDLRKQVDDVCLEFATDFETNRSKYAGHDGYNLRIEAARLCLLRLEQAARTTGDTKASQVYADRINQYVNERNHISDTKRW
jgi:hypothetical protein